MSEKAAALEVVEQRLDDRNLGDFALNCHSHKASKKEIVTELGRCLNLPGEEYASRDGDAAFQNLVAVPIRPRSIPTTDVPVFSAR